jgi:hypothetical protein
MLRYKTALYAGIYLIFIFQLIKLPNNWKAFNIC